MIIGIGLVVAFVSFVTGKDPVFWVVAGILLAVFGSVRLKKQNSENEFFHFRLLKLLTTSGVMTIPLLQSVKRRGKYFLAAPRNLNYMISRKLGVGNISFTQQYLQLLEMQVN